nr:hypothetical protein [Candidatus Sigynarchaeota archaeon]
MCKTCQFFDHEKSSCKNPKKAFVHSTERRIYDPTVMRCAAYVLDRNVSDFLHGIYSKWSLADFKQKCHDLEEELSFVKDYELIKQRFGDLLQGPAPPFVEAKSNAAIAAEIDLSIQFKRFYKDIDALGSTFLWLDDVHLDSIVVSKMTVQVIGHRQKSPRPPYHHAIAGIVAEKFIIRQSEVACVEIHQNGRYLRASIADAITLLQQPAIIGKALDAIDENREIIGDLDDILRSFFVHCGLTSPWNDLFAIWHHDFVDLATFKQVFHLFKKDAYRSLDISICNRDGSKQVELVKTPFSCGEFAELAGKLQAYLEKPCTWPGHHHPAIHLYLSPDDKGIIEEMQSIK